MIKVLITGAGGFVGYHLTQCLLRKGYEVVGAGHRSAGAAIQQPHYTGCRLDVTRRESVLELVAATKPDFIVHGAAVTQPDLCEQQPEVAWTVNVQGTAHVVEAAAVAKAHLLHLSTDFVFAGNKAWYTEADEPDPVNYYGHTKMEAERLVQAYPGAWTLVRPILIYGPVQGARNNIVTMVAEALQAGKTLQLFTDQQRRPTYVTDLTWGIERLLALAKTGVYHFCGAEALSPFDIGIEVARLLGYGRELIQEATAATFQQPAARPPHTAFSLEKVQDELGYRPTAFRDGVAATLAHWAKG